MNKYSDYQKKYYLNNKEKYRENFNRWYSKNENKEKMKIYMRNYMRKKLNITKDKYRIKGDKNERR